MNARACVPIAAWLICSAQIAAAQPTVTVEQAVQEAVENNLSLLAERLNLTMADAAIALGFHISFSGIVTFKNAGALKDVARAIPLERLLVETDSPYLAPVPHRGKTNRPALVRYVAEEVARLRGIELSELSAATTGNFFRLFK